MCIHSVGYNNTGKMNDEIFEAGIEGIKELNISVCKFCYYPRKAIPDERAFVGDREIWIENYINSAQEGGL